LTNNHPSATHRVSVECPTFRTVLVTLYGHDANTPAQDRTQLGIAELVKGAVVVDRRVDYLHGLAFEAIGDLLEGPSLLVLDRTLNKLLGELVDLLALLLVDSTTLVGRNAQDVDLVVRYTKGGAPYLMPPYSAAEKKELFKGLNDTPTVVGRYRKPQDQQQPQLQQAEQRPHEDEQP
jgi:hypothetical protein